MSAWCERILCYVQTKPNLTKLGPTKHQMFGLISNIINSIKNHRIKSEWLRENVHVSQVPKFGPNLLSKSLKLDFSSGTTAIS